MTPDQIRAEYAEIFARVTYERIRAEYSTIETREPWEALTEEAKQMWLGQEDPYVEALAAAGRLPADPVAYVVFSNRTFLAPGPLRDVHLRLTFGGAVDVQAMLEDRAAVNSRWYDGVEYLIGGIHPVPRSVLADG